MLTYEFQSRASDSGVERETTLRTGALIGQWTGDRKESWAHDCVRQQQELPWDYAS
jgi:hypothetical protein